MVNYQNGKIYKIKCNKTGLVYVGSTCEKYLSSRLSKHLGSYKKYIKEPTKHPYTTSYEVLKNNDFSIELIEKVSCEIKEELLAREKYYIQSIECVNICVPCRTNKEYYDDNKEKIIAQVRNYRLQNVEKIQEYEKNRTKKRKEHKREYDLGYRNENKEKIKAYNKQYREQHKPNRN